MIKRQLASRVKARRRYGEECSSTVEGYNYQALTATDPERRQLADDFCLRECLVLEGKREPQKEDQGKVLNMRPSNTTHFWFKVVVFLTELKEGRKAQTRSI